MFAATGGGTGATAALELSVVMPCLNEERTLPVCIAKALKTMAGLGIEGEVLVVDNGSTDRSVEVARRAAPGWWCNRFAGTVMRRHGL